MNCQVSWSVNNGYIPLNDVHAAKYLLSVVKFYQGKAHHQKAVEELVDKAIGENGKWNLPLGWADGLKPDCSWWYDEFLTLVLELKNMLGLSGDALLQAIVNYSKIVLQEKVRCPVVATFNLVAYLCLQFKHFQEFCNFPVVLISATANRLEISIAICIGLIYVTKLLMLNLSLGFHASDNITCLAHVFWALSCCLADLKTYYDRVRNLDSPRLSCLYPNPIPVDPSKALPKLTYRWFLSQAGQPTSALVDLGNATTIMYTATLSNTNQDVIVKFTVRYNEVARLLTEAELTPRLHFCERVIGDLYMVVMDHVDGKSIWQLREDKIVVPAIISKGWRCSASPSPNQCCLWGLAGPQHSI